MCFIKSCVRCSSMWECGKCKKGFALQKSYMGDTVCVRWCRWGFIKRRVNGVYSCVRRNENISTTSSITDTTMMTTPQPIEITNATTVTTQETTMTATGNSFLSTHVPIFTVIFIDINSQWGYPCQYSYYQYSCVAPFGYTHSTRQPRVS